MTTETIQVKRTAVQASDSLVGKTVLLPDGTKSKIAGVPSGTSYSIDGQRARASAYLIVKEGRAFKLLTQEEVDGTVLSIKDSGGYATYKFAPVTKKPARTPRTPRTPKVEAEEPKKPARTPRKGSKVQEKSEPVAVVSPAVALIVGKGLPISEKAAVALRKEITQLIASHIHAGAPEQVEITSESKFSDSRFHLSIGIDFSCLAAEEESSEVSIDDALDILLEANLVTPREARRMSDEDVMSMYQMYVDDNAEENNDLGSDVDEDGLGDDEDGLGDDEDDAPTQEEIKLPDAACKGFESLKGKAREHLLGQMLDATGLEECVAGALFALSDKDGNEDGTVAFVNFVNTKGKDVALLMRVEEFEENGAIKRVALPAGQFTRLAPIFGNFDDESQVNEEEDDLDADLDLSGL